MKTISTEVSIANLERHTSAIAQWVRLSGSRDEREAFAYVRSELGSYGFAINQYESEALIGYPGSSTLEVLGAESIEVQCNSYSLSPSTPAEGIRAELIYVGDGADADYAGKDVTGKVVLSDGLATPGKAVAAMQAGAAGQVHINDAHIHEMCISPVWGTPLPETGELLPSVPAVGISQADGDQLKQMLASGSLEVRLMTQPYRQWTKIPTLIADLPGRNEDTFVLFSGHIDSWHYGAMDNGTANATQIEVGRLLAENREALERGVRLAFWSGHSHGRYAGSAWYADQHWQELHDNCVCHVNIDSVGAITADVLEEAPTMAESFEFARDVLRAMTGRELTYKRISRSGDQSFWGHGVPSLFISLSEQAMDESPTSQAMGQLLGTGGRGGGLGWWWHTTEDTLDKIDSENLLRDARVYAETLWRLCTEERLPFNYAATAKEISAALSNYNEKAGSAFDLAKTIALANELADRLESLNLNELDPQDANTFIMRIGRILTPVNYTREGPYSQDLALGTAPMPGLLDVSKLMELDPGTDDYRFLMVRLVRERNRIEHALIEATRRAGPLAPKGSAMG